MPPRCCPLTVYLLVGKSRKWQTLTLCGRCNIFDASEKFSVTLLPCVAGEYFRCLREVPEKFLRDPGPMIACDPTSFLRGRCNLFDACDPTYLWGRVASDYFLALPTHPLVAWPYLRSDRLWPYRQFVTLAMGFAWQVQQFRCLRDVVPWPHTCLLGRVASDRHWLCVAGAIFSMPPRSSLWPYFLVWQVNIFDASEKFLRSSCVTPGPWSLVTPPPFCVAGAIFSMPVTLPTFGVGSHVTTSWPCPHIHQLRDPTYVRIACDPIDNLWPLPWVLRGRCNNFDASEMLSPDRILACWEESQVTDTDFVLWQVQYFRCLREVLCDPTSLCGRCNIFDASEKFFVVSRSFCVAGAIFSMPPRSSWEVPAWPRAHDRLWPHLLFAWQVQSFRCLWPYLPLG